MNGNEQITQELITGLGDSFQIIGTSVVAIIPKIVIAILIILIGWFIGWLIGRGVAQLISAIKIDKVLQSAGVEDVLTKAGFRLDSGMFIGGLVKWFVIVVALVAAFDVLGLETVNAFLMNVILGYLPKVVAAVLILLVAAVVADYSQKVVTGASKAAGVKYAHLLGGVTRWSIWVFAILIALDQLGIVQEFAQTLFMGIVIMLALAGGLAFGLGGKDAATRFIEKLRGDITHHD